MTHRKKLFPRLAIYLAIIAATLAIYFFVDFTEISDRIKSIGYTPSPEITALESDLALTGKAKIILAASHPTIEDRDQFNTNCASHNIEISILGCYTGEKIYLYNITNPELAGIKQTTLAHELLHAIYSRLPTQERDRLTPFLTEIYHQHLDTLESRLNNYAESNRIDELHSIIGTELADLPPTLESHYAKYFTSRTNLLTYFNAYDTKFQSIQAEADTLLPQIESLKSAIESKTTDYYDGVDELNREIADFKRRADSDYFTSEAAFRAERATLQQESDRLTTLYESINALVIECNTLVDKYNANVTIAQSLTTSINSNAAPPTL
jgi:Skp family chaperone for outer membrane proteins